MRAAGTPHNPSIRGAPCAPPLPTPPPTLARGLVKGTLSSWLGAYSSSRRSSRKPATEANSRCGSALGQAGKPYEARRLRGRCAPGGFSARASMARACEREIRRKCPWKTGSASLLGLSAWWVHPSLGSGPVGRCRPSWQRARGMAACSRDCGSRIAGARDRPFRSHRKS
jgi:hypothetical protein